MANYPKKLKDPTDNALTAIQEVLSTTDQPADKGRGTGAETASQREAGRRARAAAPTPEADLFEGATPAGEDDTRPGRRAANDDRQSIGRILESLQRRPSKTSYVVASIFALAWVVGGLTLALLYLPDLRATITQAPSHIPAMIGLAGFVLAPVVLFYVMAYIVWRAQEIGRASCRERV